MSAAIHLEKTCRTCAKRDTARCEEKKEGRVPGPGDWCYAHRAKKVNTTILADDYREGAAVEEMS